MPGRCSAVRSLSASDAASTASSRPSGRRCRGRRALPSTYGSGGGGGVADEDAGGDVDDGSLLLPMPHSTSTVCKSRPMPGWSLTPTETLIAVANALNGDVGFRMFR